MLHAFRVVCSVGAKWLTEKERHALVLEVAKLTEKLPKDRTAILSETRGLKIVVRIEAKEIWIMSNDEADAGGLPSVRDN